MNHIKDAAKFYFGTLGVIFAIIGAFSIFKSCNTPPVEESTSLVLTTDSVIKVNDSIKLKVEHLDSIKNAKIIEVSALDNDSTVKLFFELVSE